jgi:hypothetical protein
MPSRRDFDKDIASVVSLVAAARTATANGTAADLANFNAACAILSAGVITDGTHTVKLQDSPDNSVWTDVTAANLSGAFTALTSGAGGSATQEVGYLGAARYLRAVTTVATATTGGVYAVDIVRADARNLPQ